MPGFNLPKGLTITLMLGNSMVMRHRIVTCWMELESQVQKPAFVVPTNFADALRLAAEQPEQTETAKAELAT